jgi:hypothetical protein
MILIIILGAVAGAVLGSHFRVFVLGPAILLVSAATVTACFTRGIDAHTIVLDALAVLLSLQFGYVIGGVAATYFRVQTKLPRPTWTPSQHIDW